MSNMPSFFVFAGAPVAGYEQSWVILTLIEPDPHPVFEQFLITPGREPLVSLAVYRHGELPLGTDHWQQQIHEAEVALDGIRMDLRAQHGGEVPVPSKIESVEQRTLLHLWMQQTNRRAIETISRLTKSQELRDYLRLVMSVEVARE
jgi:hypothetical protein